MSSDPPKIAHVSLGIAEWDLRPDGSWGSLGDPNSEDFTTQVSPVVLEGLGSEGPITLSSPGARARFQVWSNFDTPRTFEFKVDVTYVGVRDDGTPILRLQPNITRRPPDPPKNPDPDPEEYDGPVVSR